MAMGWVGLGWVGLDWVHGTAMMLWVIGYEFRYLDFNHFDFDYNLN
jgi:hypothetical protein